MDFRSSLLEVSFGLYYIQVMLFESFILVPDKISTTSSIRSQEWKYFVFLDAYTIYGSISIIRRGKIFARSK